MIIYISALLVLGVVLVAHIFGIDGLYYQINNYDVFMHFFGGVGIALFVMALLKSYEAGVLFSRKNIILGTIIVGIVWELFEIYYNLTGHPLWSKLYYLDTIKDLIMDTIGGGTVALIIARKETSTIQVELK